MSEVSWNGGSGSFSGYGSGSGVSWGSVFCRLDGVGLMSGETAVVACEVVGSPERDRSSTSCQTDTAIDVSGDGGMGERTVRFRSGLALHVFDLPVVSLCRWFNGLFQGH